MKAHETAELEGESSSVSPTTDTTPPLPVRQGVRRCSPSSSTGQRNAQKNGRPPLQLRPKAARPSMGRRTSSSQWFPPSPVANSQPEPEAALPRTLEDLHMERLYLLESLHEHDKRARILFTQLSSTQERLPCAQTLNESKKIRKAVNTIRKNINRNATQERSTLARLSDLYIEIQGRERWHQIQQQKAASQACLFGPYYPVSPCIMAPPMYSTMPSPVAPDSPSTMSCLSPLSPTFVPGTTFPESIFWAGGVRDGEDSSTQTNTEGLGDKDDDEHASPGLRWEFAVDDWEDDGYLDIMSKAHERRCSMATTFPPSFKLCHRRLSLPSLRTYWPGSFYEEDEK
ncbi:hypothetical protein QBC33DRAFT_510814 [Phialemonium atrogriseum]|uniref:Uncharacterized protein n=1 Tax=Phialemonium atrogriseum TaxID=1093897 RepID=A0AAJ0C6X5_9PEZI|nr:uncharacterized protein QBC33DRAFT_510814 [Phialemonium atrogriseum]KAK1771278.1 hypothetical protein QBC33DRAFT_510814 [Phialemonium atrogriseum]